MENKSKSRFKIANGVLIFWTLFIGVGAVVGSACMFADPSGKILQMDALLPYFQALPFADVLFRDLLFSGVALLIVNGITNLISAVLLFLKKKVGVILGGVFGVTLMLWIIIQFCIFPLNFMSTIFFIFGFCQAVTGYATYVFMEQETFAIDLDDYQSVGQNPEELVVYFSRMGYVKKQAYEIANASGADIYEIKSTERTAGTLGFWWCGRFGMHRWEMPIEDITIDLTAYKKVIVCSPIWVFALSAPVRSFCKAASGKIKNAEYVLLHFTNGDYANAAREMDELLGLENSKFRSIRCRTGKFKEMKNRAEKSAE